MAEVGRGHFLTAFSLATGKMFMEVLSFVLMSSHQHSGRQEIVTEAVAGVS